MVSGGKLFLIFHGRFPGEKAAAIFTAKNAEAFAEAGFVVTVLAPRRLARLRKSPQEFFGVKNNFRVVYLPIIDLFAFPFLKYLAFTISYSLFSISVFFYFLFTIFYSLFSSRSRENLIYSNEPLPLLFASMIFPKTFFEVHDFPRKSFLNKILMSRVMGIISTNRWKADELVRRFDIPRDKILFEPNAVDASRFGRAIGKEIRQRLPLATDTVLIGYAGTLKTMSMEKGIQTLLEALVILPKRFKCLIIGGLREDIEIYRKEANKLGVADRAVFTGWMHYDSVPEHLAACDILVAPFPKTEHYEHYMSPMKIFEYMAAGKPIVASRLQAIIEVVGEDAAYFAEPDNPKDLAKAIEKAASDAGAKEKVARAREIIERHTWTKRAERITEFIKKW